MTTLPSLSLLNKINQFIKTQREEKFSLNYGLFLLSWKSGLRVSEAVSFNYHLKHPRYKDLYSVVKGKGNKTRYVYVSKEVIQELKTNCWKPNQTNRINFYHFLKKVKQEANISLKTELTPHNLRRAFATHHAEAGAPLPLLQKLLGHSSIRTTALYWRDIYSNDDDPNNILACKKWLERLKPSQNREKEPSKAPIENFPKQLPENSESDIISNKPIISAEKPVQQDNSLLNAEKEKSLAITNYQPKLLTNEISPKNQEEFSLNITRQKIEISEQLPVITNEREQTTAKEEILSTKIKQLEEQLAQVQAENNHLKLENQHLKALIRKDQATEAKILQILPLKGK